MKNKLRGGVKIRGISMDKQTQQKAQKAANALGLGLSAYIRMLINSQPERESKK